MKKIAMMFVLLTSMCWGKDNVELLISPEEISARVCEVAGSINKEYAGEELTIVMVMKGAVCITADLIRCLDVPCSVEYIRASSYGKNGTFRGELRVTGADDLDLEGKNVLVVDDIFDTGHTMLGVVKVLEKKNPKSIKSLVLLSKNIARETSYRPDYSLFEIKNRFVIGYGLDYKEHYRELPGIYAFINDTPPASR